MDCWYGEERCPWKNRIGKFCCGNISTLHRQLVIHYESGTLKMNQSEWPTVGSSCIARGVRHPSPSPRLFATQSSETTLIVLLIDAVGESRHRTKNLRFLEEMSTMINNTNDQRPHLSSRYDYTTWSLRLELQRPSDSPY